MLQWIGSHPELAAWVQAVGSILAIVAAFLIPVFRLHADKNHVRLLALMEIAIGLRRWIRDATSHVLNVHGWNMDYEPEPALIIPPMPYSARLITKVGGRAALDLAKLAEARERAVDQVRDAEMYEGHGAGFGLYEAETSRLILAALDLSRRIARQVRWDFEDIDQRHRETLTKLVHDYDNREPVNLDFLKTEPS